MCLYLNVTVFFQQQSYTFVTIGWVYNHSLLIPQFVMGHIVFFVCFSAKKLLPKKKLAHLPYFYQTDAQAQFTQRLNATSCIHIESMKNYLKFLNEMAGKVVSVNVQLV